MREWCFEHYFLTFLIIGSLIQGIYSLFNRIIRHQNIKHAGWPPAHLDADGDPLNKDKDEDI